MCTPHDLFGHWHNDMSPVFWTRDLSFNWLSQNEGGASLPRMVVYVYGGIVNRANEWLASSHLQSMGAGAYDSAAVNTDTLHVAMSFESPDPLISRAFLAAAAEAAGAFNLFMCCVRDVMQSLPPQQVMFMSCGWAEGSPPVEEWRFSAEDKWQLVSMQVFKAVFAMKFRIPHIFSRVTQASTSNFTLGHGVRLQASELLKDSVHRFGRGHSMYNSPADYLKAASPPSPSPPPLHPPPTLLT
jgi:hypothetical protein